jgi:hypothetical protein
MRVNCILDEIIQERKRQDEKWGEQNHPMLDTPFTVDGMRQREKNYKQTNDSKRDVSWFAILMEEVYEAFAETEPEKQYGEMIQVAAVAVQIAEYLKRKKNESRKVVRIKRLQGRSAKCMWKLRTRGT